MPDELDSLFPGLTDILHSADWAPSPGSVLQADPHHGGVTDESLREFINQRMSQGIPALHELPTSGGGVVAPAVVDQGPPAGEDEDGEEVPPTSEPPGEPVEPGEEEPPGPGTVPAPGQEAPTGLIDIGGRQFTPGQLEAFARFSDSLDTDPALQSLLTSYYSGRMDALLQPAQPQPAFPAAPDLSQAAATGGLNLDLDDPNVAALAQLLQAQQAQISALQQQTTSVAQQSIARSAQEAEALMNRAATSFAQQHSLSDDDITRLRRSAARLGVLEPLMSGIDPITNAPVRPDLLSATERALEIAMYADPAYRQRQIDAALDQRREKSRKRQKLAGIGGSSGSVSRTTTAPRPGTPESRKAMTDEVAAMMSGTWNEP